MPFSSDQKDWRATSSHSPPLFSPKTFNQILEKDLKFSIVGVQLFMPLRMKWPSQPLEKGKWNLNIVFATGEYRHFFLGGGGATGSNFPLERKLPWEFYLGGIFQNSYTEFILIVLCSLRHSILHVEMFGGIVSGNFLYSLNCMVDFPQ